MFKKNKLENAFQFNWGVQSEIFDIKVIQKTIIGIDAGGTKTLVAHCDAKILSELRKPRVNTQTISGQERYVNREYGSLAEIISNYLGKFSIQAKDAILAIAGAGPLKGRVIEMSNRSWTINADEIQSKFSFDKVFLINDLESMIYSLDSISPEDLMPLNNVAINEFGTVAVIAAGTGLGESCGFYLPERNSHVAIGGEGGNSDFAPANDLEIDLYRHLRNINGYVSWEDLLSGKGLINIYNYLIQSDQEQNPETVAQMQTNDSAEVIVESGISRRDSTCIKTLELFISLYGAEAGNLALKCLPYGGLYIAGGIISKMLPLLKEPLFMNRFLAKGRLKPVLEKIPVFVITNSGYGVIGAINYALLQK